MAFNNKIFKILLMIVLSISLISAKSVKVLADSKLSVNIDRQIEFLEEKRISQGFTLSERQSNAIVEGMQSSPQKEEIPSQQRIETDTFSEVVRSIRKLQSKKQGSKKPDNKLAKTNRYYKNTNIPIISYTREKTERISLRQPEGSTKDRIEGNNLLKQFNSIRDMMGQAFPNRDPIDLTDSEIEMFERIVMAESGGEPYLGQLAVANVVLNRVKSNRYPSTLEEVVFQRSQFSPVKNGVIVGRMPNTSVKKAVAEAVSGKMVVPANALYFVNPVLATDQTVPRTKTPVRVIGSHTFYK